MRHVEALTGNRALDLLTERRYVINEMRQEKDPMAREALRWDIVRIDEERASL